MIEDDEYHRDDDSVQLADDVLGSDNEYIAAESMIGEEEEVKRWGSGESE